MRKTVKLHTLIYQAPDVPGQWIAHCLEIDLVTQGNSAPHALEMIAEAIEIVAKDNVARGRPAIEIRPAPAEDWARLAYAEDLATRLLHLPKSQATIVPSQLDDIASASA